MWGLLLHLGRVVAAGCVGIGAAAGVGARVGAGGVLQADEWCHGDETLVGRCGCDYFLGGARLVLDCGDYGDFVGRLNDFGLLLRD